MKAKVSVAVLLTLAVVGILFIPSPKLAYAQPSFVQVHTLEVTIGAGTNTQVSTTDLFARQVMIQNNAAHNMRVGDSTVTSSSNGALLASGTPGGSINFGPLNLGSFNLSNFYVAGTAADVVEVIYVQ